MTCCKNHPFPRGWLQSDSSSYCSKFKIAEWCTVFLVRFWCGSLWPHNLWFQYNYNTYLKGQRKDRIMTTLPFGKKEKGKQHKVVFGPWPHKVVFGRTGRARCPCPGGNVSSVANLAGPVCSLEGSPLSCISMAPGAVGYGGGGSFYGL